MVSDWRKDSQRDQLPFSRIGMLIELFGHPNHGLTVGYSATAGRTMPVFKKTPQETQYQKTSEVLQGILAYAGKYGACYPLHRSAVVDLLADARSSMREWCRATPRRDAEALRGFFITYDWPEEGTIHLVHQVGFHDLVRPGHYVKRVSTSQLPAATLALAPVPAVFRIAYLLRLYAGYALEKATAMAKTPPSAHE